MFETQPQWRGRLTVNIILVLTAWIAIFLTVGALQVTIILTTPFLMLFCVNFYCRYRGYNIHT